MASYSQMQNWGEVTHCPQDATAMGEVLMVTFIILSMIKLIKLWTCSLFMPHVMLPSTTYCVGILIHWPEILLYWYFKIFLPCKYELWWYYSALKIISHRTRNTVFWTCSCNYRFLTTLLSHNCLLSKKYNYLVFHWRTTLATITMWACLKNEGVSP